jgi:hypothetical protein
MNTVCTSYIDVACPISECTKVYHAPDQMSNAGLATPLSEEAGLLYILLYCTELDQELEDGVSFALAGGNWTSTWRSGIRVSSQVSQSVSQAMQARSARGKAARLAPVYAAQRWTITSAR